jgi:hypothetical protein
LTEKDCDRVETCSRITVALSIDMDNQWSYMKTHGEAGWKSYPSYFDTLLPYLLDLLDELDLSITFFLVGDDVLREKNHHAIQQIGLRGHEAGNHSLTHEPWLHLYSRGDIEHEIETTHDAIKDVVGKAPRGFRGPGFSWSATLLDVLAAQGYEYDASTLPTFIGPLARWYYFATADLSREERTQRKKLFGTLADGFRPIRPYTWELPTGQRLFEIPVTTIPVFRTPFHLSYLIYLSRYSLPLMEAYLKVAIMMCKATGTAPSFLLHPLDILGGDQVPELRFFPGMDLDAATKRSLFLKVMQILGRHFEIVNMSTYVDRLSQTGSVSSVVPVGAGT